MLAGSQILEKNVNFDELIVISVQACMEQGGETVCFRKSCTNRTTMMYSPLLLPLLAYGPKHENFKAYKADFGRYRSILLKMVPMGIKLTKQWEKRVQRQNQKFVF